MHPVSAVCLQPLALIIILYSSRSQLSTFRFRLCGVLIVFALALHTIFLSSEGNAACRYLCSLFSAWFVMWAAVTLLVDFPLHQERRPLGPSTAANSSKQCERPRCLKQFEWAWDITTNFRQLGLHAQKTLNGRQGPDRYRQTTNERPIAALWVYLRSMVLSYLWLDSLHVLLFCRSNNILSLNWVRFFRSIILQTTILRVSASLTMFCGILSLTHAFGSLVKVLMHIAIFGGLKKELPHRPLWGPVAKLYTSGVRGFWGNCWHDLFRYGFVTCGRLYEYSSWQAHPVSQVLSVFFLSGLMHTAAAVASFRNGRASFRSFAFFASQPFVIIVEQLIVKHIVPQIIPKAFQHATTGTLQFLLVLLSVYLASHLLIEDMIQYGFLYHLHLPWSVIELLPLF